MTHDEKYDPERARPYLDQYAKLRDGGLFYNDDFRGRIPEIAGREDEDTLIYLLSGLWRVAQEQAEIEEATSEGFKPATSTPGGRRKYAEVIVYRPGHYSGGTGDIRRYLEARVLFDEEGAPLGILRKGARTQAFNVTGAEVLVK